MCKLYERAVDKVYGKLSNRYVSKSEMEVLLKDFYDLKSLICERLLLIEIMQNDLASSTSINECIANGSTLYASDYEEKMREHLIAAMDEWNEMRHLYLREAGQRKSRISENDLEVHHVLLFQIREHIYAMNDEELTGIPNNLGNDDKSIKSTVPSLSKIETPNNNSKNKNMNQTNDILDNPLIRKQKILGQPPKTNRFDNLDNHSIRKQKILGQPPKTSRSTEKYDRKQMDEKIIRMEEKIENLKAIAIERAEVAVAQNDIIQENISNTNDSGAFEINEANEKLIAFNKALSFQRREMRKQNKKSMVKKETIEGLDDANGKPKECLELT